MQKFTLCVRMYVCIYEVRHNIQIPCARYVAINCLYLYHIPPAAIIKL